MKTIIKKLLFDENNNNLNDEVLVTAAEILRKGGLVAFPTETVYGLGGDAFDETAAGRIYAAKGRPSDNPLIVHISDIKDLARVSDEIPECAYKLADEFWPGPLTVILKKNDKVPMSVTGGLDTVAVRLPSHPVARAIIAQSGTLIAAPSANLSGKPSPTIGSHVVEDLDGRIDMIIDGGSIDIGLESTIVDLTGEIPMILRPGYVTKEMLENVIGKVEIDPAIMCGVKADVAPKAPGMKYRHYAPKAELIIVKGEEIKVIEKLKELLQEGLSQGLKVGIMTTKEKESLFTGGEIICLGSGEDGSEIARHLFGTLRSFDELGVDVIYSEAFDEEGIGQAIMNRLRKAAGHKTIDV